MESDLISRSALESDLRDYADRKNGNGENVLANGILSAVSRLKYAPSVDAVLVVHARWIGTEYDAYADGSPIYETWECSECHEEHYGDCDTLTAYCPHCGAKMDGKEPG